MQNILDIQISGYVTKLDALTGQLQQTLNVAGYAIGVENLENVLNAANLLDAPALR